jgi:hypothetical protein
VFLPVLMVVFLSGGMAGAQVASGGLLLPPAGTDELPATSADVVIDFGEGNVQTLQCSGPTRIMRGEPSGGTIQTEMLQLDLKCGNGVMIHLDPNRTSPGQIQSNGDSFFDVFFEVTTPQGTLVSQNAARMESKIGHVPPLGSHYLSQGPVTLTGPLTAVVRSVRHAVNGVPKPESSGEVSPVFSCFYECKLDRKEANWLEVTSLILVNQSVRLPLIADMLFVNGNQQAIGRAITNLSPLDLDEVNVCATLDKAGLGVPPAGLIEVVLSVPGQNVPAGGAYGWVKNVIGKIPRDEPEPFHAKVSGVGKTACRVVGPNVVRPDDILQRGAGVPIVNPVLIEGTAD